MASGTPKWDAAGASLVLAHSGYHIDPDSPQPRMTQHTVPGVDGVFVGLHGVGPRYWTGRGFLETTAVATEALAAQDVKDAVLAIQSVVGNEIKSYTDSTGDVYTNCVLLSYRKAGPITTHPSAAQFTGRCPVTFVIMQQDAS